MKTNWIAFVATLALCIGMVRAEDDVREIVDASKLKDEKAENATLPTFYIAGDSTVRIGGSGRPKVGWGEVIAPYFDLDEINVVNKAIGGRSARTFHREGRWQWIEDNLKKGDFVIIQFGHNDGGRVGDPSNKHRADLPGTGDETAPDDMGDGTVEEVHTYGWYLKQFVTGANAKGATVILCSPIPHLDRWENGRDFEGHAKWAKEVADANDAYFMDLTMIITEGYKELGMEKVKPFFEDKRTHTTDAGAQFNAKAVISGLKGLEGKPLKKYFSKEARFVEAYQH